MTNDELKALIVNAIEDAKDTDWVWSNEKDDEVPVTEIRTHVAANSIIEILIKANLINKV